MDNSTNHQSTSGPPPPKPNGKRRGPNSPSPSGTGPNNSKKAKATKNEIKLTWEQKHAALREKHIWLLMHSQGKERENKSLTNQVMEGVMELEMTKEWMADQLEELDLWRKGIYIHPDHQVKVPVSHVDTATPVSLGDPEIGDAAGSLAAENPRSYGIQDSIDLNLLKELGIPSNLANEIECSEDFLRSVGAGSCGGNGSVKTVDAMIPGTPVAGGVNAIKQEKATSGRTSGARSALQQDSHSVLVNSLQGTLDSGAVGQSLDALNSQNQQSLNWGMYIPNLHQQGALIRQDTAQNMSGAMKTPKVTTPQTQFQLDQAQPHRLQANNDSIPITYRHVIADAARTPQAPPPVNTVPSNGQQVISNAMAAHVHPAPPPAQIYRHPTQLPNSNTENLIGAYHQFIDDASQTPRASPPVQAHLHHTQFPSANNISPTGTYLRGPVANVRLTFPNNDNAAAAQIRRYQKLLEEDADRFLKMTEKHE